MGSFKEDLHSIMISRKFLGFIWIEYTHVQRNFGQSGMELFRKTKETYTQIYGTDNVRFRLHYRDLKFTGNGKQII